MKKHLILLVAGFIAVPVLASASILPEDVTVPADTVVISTEEQPANILETPTDEKKDVLPEDSKTDETISTDQEVIAPHEEDNIIKKKRDEFRLKQKNERENMRLELKKGKEVSTMSATTPVPQKSTLQKIKGFFKSLF